MIGMHFGIVFVLLIRSLISKDTVSTVGITVGISSAIVFVIIIMLTSVFCVFLRRWKHTNQQGQDVHASHVNTEFQPVTDDPEANIQTQQEYEAESTRIQSEDTDYEQ